MNEHLTTEQLIDYLHQALPPEDDAAFHAHLAACAECTRAFEREAAMGEALRAHARATEREFPSGIRATVLARAEADAVAPSPLDILRGLFRPVLAVPIAAALAVALLMVPRYVHAPAPGTPAIDAAYYLNDHDQMNGTLPFGEQTTAVPASLTNDAVVTERSTAVMPAVMTADNAP